MPQRSTSTAGRAGRQAMSAGLYEVTVNALLDRGTVLGRAEWEAAAARVGDEMVPALLVELVEADLLGRDVLARAVADAWAGPAQPTRRLEPARWMELFTEAGYAVGDGSADPATAPRLPPSAAELPWSAAEPTIDILGS